MRPRELKNAQAQPSRLQEGLIGVLDMPREISRDIHPAISTQGGVEPALRTFVRWSDASVKLIQTGRRRPEHVEVAS